MATSTPIPPPTATEYLQAAIAIIKGQAKRTTTVIVAVATLLYGLWQDQQVRDKVLAFAGVHPRIAATISFISFVLGVLHDPQVRAVIAKLKTDQGA